MFMSGIISAFCHPSALGMAGHRTQTFWWNGMTTLDLRSSPSWDLLLKRNSIWSWSSFPVQNLLFFCRHPVDLITLSPWHVADLVICINLTMLWLCSFISSFYWEYNNRNLRNQYQTLSCDNIDQVLIDFIIMGFLGSRGQSKRFPL